uniref:Uncharacterized protein n=1 Tax=Corethron hystrix TaxID=216773 RepID=A0A7S1BJ86_9STRA|mmetsp:Transcript_27642/g.63358  ORF Transcript_27642/g.63358 Transcript_27642/m.63358 type:complete len:390 (+) Transcript_27642:119-1288(+)
MSPRFRSINTRPVPMPKKNNGRRQRPPPGAATSGESDVSAPSASKKRVRTGPIFQPIRSRRRARYVTTQFHRLTGARDAALAAVAERRSVGADEGRSSVGADEGLGSASDDSASDDSTSEGRQIRLAYSAAIRSIGGRRAYQEASAFNTASHASGRYSTSRKWVLARLSSPPLMRAWTASPSGPWWLGRGIGPSRRPVRLLEIGAVNVDLLSAARNPSRRLEVRAVDLRAHAAGIERGDFLTMELEEWDCAVCSMVVNCVPNAADRGRMLYRVYGALVQGGLAFLALPSACLDRSSGMDRGIWKEMLTGGGRYGLDFEILEERNSPKVAFFVLRRPRAKPSSEEKTGKKTKQEKGVPFWTREVRTLKKKKCRSDFAVILNKEKLALEEK